MSDIRPGTREDAAPCAAILNDWIDRTEWMPRLHSKEDVARHYRDFVFVEREVHVLGTPPKAFIGLDKGGYVTTLYCAEPGQGRGKALLDHAKTLRPSLRLWTFIANESARRFYIREGFTEIDRTDGDNEENLPDICYEWGTA